MRRALPASPRPRLREIALIACSALVGCSDAGPSSMDGDAGTGDTEGTDGSVTDASADASVSASGDTTGSVDETSGSESSPTSTATDSTGDSSSSGSETDTGERPIDLTPDYATYLGGNAWERIQSVYVTDAGDIFVCGTTKSNDFPVTGGAYDTNGDGGTDNDGFVARFAPDGSLAWATYLNGTQRDDCYGVRADDTGVYVTGWTDSDNFPTTPGAYQQNRAGDMDIFVAKLSLDGTSLLWSTYVGGDSVDQSRGALVIDPANNRVVVSGYTESSNFPGTSGGYQTSYAGGLGDAVVLALSDDGSTLLDATYLGGDGPDFAFSGIGLHGDGSVTIGGSAGSASFPTTAGVVQESFGGAVAGPRWPGDAFVARLSSDLSTLVFSTFLGGTGNDHVAGQNALFVAATGEIAISGHTDSDDFPTSGGAFAPALSGAEDLFVAVLSEDGTSLIGSTYLGGTMEPAMGTYEPSGIAVDAQGRIFVSGWTGVSDFPTTANAAQASYAGGGSDLFLSVFSPDLGDLEYSTFFGGTMGSPGSERTRALWLDASTNGVVFVGDTYADDFPVTANAYQPNAAGGGDAHLSRFVSP